MNFDTKNAANFLGCSISMVRKLKENGELKYFTIGAKIMFRQADLEAFIVKNMKGDVK